MSAILEHRHETSGVAESHFKSSERRVSMRILLAAILVCLPMTLQAQVVPTNEWVNLWGDNCIVNAKQVPVGAVVRAYDPDGVLCGECAVGAAGTYGLMPVYRDDPTTPGVDEGADPGDAITITVDGVPVLSMGPDAPIWTGNGDLKKINLFHEEVIPTNEWVNFWSDSSLVDFGPLPFGSVVQAFDPDGVMCGEFTVWAPGIYGLMPVYRDDETTSIDEGAEPGDAISFKINDVPALSMGPDVPTWTSNGDRKKVNLLIGDLAPVCEVEPLTIDVGTVAIGASKDTTFTIRNEGGGVLEGDATAECAPHFTIVEGAVHYVLGSGDSIVVTLRYTPSAAGMHECEVSTGSYLCGNVQVTGQTKVATLLQNYWSGFSDAGITINWELSEIDEGVAFSVERAASAAGPFIVLPSSGLSREGLAFTFVDTGWEPGASYWYVVAYRRSDGERRILFEAGPVRTPGMPLTLYQNHPNPFNPATTIVYYLPVDCHVTLDVYDLRGNSVIRLADEHESRGPHEVSWDGRDKGGKDVSSGVYFYRLKAGKMEISRKMVLAR
jgi:hypothetical protein